MGDFAIEVMANKSPRFYGIMGPYLSRRKIVSEVGNFLWDDDDKLWFVALDDGDDVAGFAGLRILSDSLAELCSAWVRPDCRGRGIYSALLIKRIQFIDEKRLCAKTVARPKLVEILTRFGFTVVKQTENFVSLRREAAR
jgi:N-acetylglutamate synthase-like GNAT family acetyltransferase